MLNVQSSCLNSILIYSFQDDLAFRATTFGILLSLRFLDAAVQLCEVVLLRELVENLLQCGLLRLVLVDNELLSVGLHFFDEAEKVTDTLFLLIHDLDGQLIAREVDQLSLTKLLFEFTDDIGDLAEHLNLLEELLQVDRLAFLYKFVLY